MEHRREEERLFSEINDTIQQRIKQTCPVCGRGAADSKPPDLRDLEALIAIRDGFNAHRRNFTPLIREQFDRFDQTIAYLHRLIAGSVER